MGAIEQAMGILSESIVCKCGNNSTLEDFIGPTREAWYKVRSHLYYDGTDLREDTGDDVDWDTEKKAKFYCGVCDNAIIIPKSMKVRY